MHYLKEQILSDCDGLLVITQHRQDQARQGIKDDVSLSVHFASYWTLTKHYIPSTHFEGTPPRPAWPPGNPMAWCLQRQAAKQGIFVGRGTQIATLTATSGYKHCRYK